MTASPSAPPGARRKRSGPPSLLRSFGGQPSPGLPTVAHACVGRRERRLERETGIEPATNSLEGCDSTTELLPPSRLASLGATAGKPAASSISRNLTRPYGEHARRIFHLPQPHSALRRARPPHLPSLSFFYLSASLGATARHARPLPVIALRSASAASQLRRDRLHSLACLDEARGAKPASEVWWRGEDSNLRSRWGDRFTVWCV